MKIIRLTDQQRREITERRRQAQDRRIYQRLSAVLWCDAGRTREEVAELLGVSAARSATGSASSATRAWTSCAPCTTGAIPVGCGPHRSSGSEQEIAKGAFHNADQVRAWIEEHFGVAYSASGVKDLLHRIGASYHKVSGFFLEGGPGRAAEVRPQVSAASA